MRKPIIAGNWKMYKTLSEAELAFVEEVKGQIPAASDKLILLFVHLLYFLDQLSTNS